MNKYCYDIISGNVSDPDKLKQHVEKFYSRKKYGRNEDQPAPIIVIWSEKENQVCIKMTSSAKINREKIEEIHNQLTARDLKFGGVKLGKPTLFTLEQCSWWDTECKKREDDTKWTTLEHNGPYFAHIYNPYVPHGAPIIYEGRQYQLTPKEERIANFYAQRLIKEEKPNITVYWTKDKVFNDNFWNDFKTYLTPEHRKIFKDFKKLNFTKIVDKLKAIKESETTKEKRDKAIKKAEAKQNYGYAIINGIKEDLSLRIEEAGLFTGRGDNPIRGKIKKDVWPEEMTINVSRGKTPAPPPGHKWGAVIHNNTLSWTASWKDQITGKPKYINFAQAGQLKGKSDLEKFETARKLNKNIETVRDQYQRDILCSSLINRQLGTVLYLIDNYGIRAGGEKDTDKSADTVGASTLKVSDVKLKPPHTIVFDFLGKDSVRFNKEILVPDTIYKNFAEFLRGKSKTSQLFDKISATDINNYLKTFDKDFTAKVFRTRLASEVMYAGLHRKLKKSATDVEKKTFFVLANTDVANLLNHKRTISKKAQETVEKKKEELKELKKELKTKKAEGKSTETLQKRIAAKQADIEKRENTMDVAITTSLTNYIDPRIVVSWVKTNKLEPSKVYTKALQEKFKWAIDITKADWDYYATPLLPGFEELEPSEGKLPATKTGKKPSKPAAKKPTQKRESKKPPAKTVEVELEVEVDDKDEEEPETEPVVVKKAAKPVNLIVRAPLEMVDYSSNAIAVFGDTRHLRNEFLGLNGRYNPNLTRNNEKVAGWIFSKVKKSKVQKILENSKHGLLDLEKILINKIALSLNGIDFVKEQLDKLVVEKQFYIKYLECFDYAIEEDKIDYSDFSIKDLKTLVIETLDKFPEIFLTFLVENMPDPVRRQFVLDMSTF